MKICHKGIDYYLSWHWKPSPDNNLNLSATFARTLGIKEDEEVLVSCIPQPGSLRSLVVTPKNSDDWEIVDLQSNRIQSTLLDQINIVARNQPLIVWVSKSFNVTLLVESLEPNFQYGKLEQFTEIIVSAPKREITASSSETQDNPAGSSRFAFWNILRNWLPPVAEKSATEIAQDTQNELNEYRAKSSPEIMRVLELPKSREELIITPFNLALLQPFCVYVRRRYLSKDLAKDDICKIRKVKEDRQFVKVTNTNFLRGGTSAVPRESSELVVKLKILEDLLEICSKETQKLHFANSLVHPSIYMSRNLRLNLELKLGAKVILEPLDVPGTNVPPTGIDIFPYENNLVTLESFESYVRARSGSEGVLLNTCSTLILEDQDDQKEYRCIVRFLPQDCRYVLLDDISLKHLTVQVKDETVKPANELINESSQIDNLGHNNVPLKGLEIILRECRISLDLSLGLTPISLDFSYDRENVIICGPAGVGKTTLCQILGDDLRGAPNFVHTRYTDCKSLKGKKAEMLHKIILPAIIECAYHQPSILFLDDLDSITSTSSNEEENTPDAINAARITDMLINIMSEYQRSYYISVVATCTDLNKVNQRLRAPRGVHLFRTILRIPLLEKEDRINLMKSILEKKLKVSDEIDWDACGTKTEGWVIQDLVDVAEKAAFAAWKRHVKGKLGPPPVKLLEEDLTTSLTNSKPMALHGVNLYKGEGHSWSDIGGLSDAKRSLIELLQWPLKYPQIFKNAPIKQQSGVLLYGMPGTGKTMLASAIAKECGLNLISVKGPELLSKYIGASEESVRNIFEKAERAKPCVLFFDEFDSLAPRRGHDSTGVTDRVVNQLLTQLDGVEGREGVAVVAASSRPDLLDPALLRPGRLDKSLLCSLPTESEREEILIALCKAQGVQVQDLQTKELAELSEGFTGADLNAAINQARLSAIEEALATGQTDLEGVNLTQKDLVESLRTTHPSLSASEKNKYTRIYARFSQGDSVAEDLTKNQRATLA
ncbi:peroxisome biogenesis factor 1 isoform X2 [Cephus cinctus]|nr:peroxisome biogenesis factor 1 isoform X2 [Cephus cinctus]